MFKIIGKDGKEYGPIGIEELRKWINQRRLDALSRIKPEGATEWKALGDFPEFKAALDSAKEAAPPPIPPQQQPAKVSGMAITSLVLGVLGLFTLGITAIFGLVFGIVALVRIQKKEPRLSGSGLAIGGICVSGAMLLMLPIMAAMLLPALAKAKSKAQSIQCMNNIKQLNLALMMYAGDHADQFPPADQWCDLIKPYTGGSTVVYHCVSEPEGQCSYTFNASLGNLKLSDLSSPAQSVLIFSAADGWNQSGGIELATPHHHGGRSLSVGFADGHAEITQAKLLRSKLWESSPMQAK